MYISQRKVKNMKKVISLLLATLMMLTLVSCGDTAADEDKVYEIGICQLVQHPALDEATKALKTLLPKSLATRLSSTSRTLTASPPTAPPSPPSSYPTRLTLSWQTLPTLWQPLLRQPQISR